MPVFVLVQLKPTFGQVNMGRTKWPQIGPAYRIEVLRVEFGVFVEDHGGIHFKYFKKDNNVLLENVLSKLIDDELLIPLTRVDSLYPHVEKLSCERQEEVHVFVVEFRLVHLVWIHLHGRCSFFVPDSRGVATSVAIIGWVGHCLFEVHTSFYIDNVDPYKRMTHLFVEQKRTSLVDFDFQGEPVLVRLSENLVELLERLFFLHFLDKTVAATTAIAHHSTDLVADGFEVLSYGWRIEFDIGVGLVDRLPHA